MKHKISQVDSEMSLQYINFNRIADQAAKSGRLDIVEDMIERGATDFDWIAEGAAMGGHMNIVNYVDSNYR